jgi:hypothetical protein
MTAEEAKMVYRIVCTADGGCSKCAPELLELLEAAFPNQDWPPFSLPTGNRWELLEELRKEV